MDAETWKVGELAERTNLSVRTLHYYDEIGLLRPSHRTRSGHRLYDAEDVARLQQIKSLRQLGFSLEQVREALKGAAYSPKSVIEMHIERLGQQIELQRVLRARLERIAARLESNDQPSIDDLFRAVKETEMIENYSKHYTPQQQERLEQRQRTIGDERIRQVEAEWAELIAQVRGEMEGGADPAGQRMQELAKRWMGLIREFTAGDAGLEMSLGKVWREEPGLHEKCGTDAALFEFVGKAAAALRSKD